MRKFSWFIVLMSYCLPVNAQSVEKKLLQAVQQFGKDSQMRYALLGFVVADAATGKILFAHNDQVGLAPGSTQKIFTSIAALELLGNDYRYKTRLAYKGKIKDGVLDGHLFVIGSGDPSLGSWRYAGTRDSVVLKQWSRAVRAAGISGIQGKVTTNEAAFSHQAIPDGWIWQDMANYYGAGAYQLNWKENQYDLILRSGNRVGDSVIIVQKKTGFPFNADVDTDDFVNELRTAAKGTGDNAYIYFKLTENRHALLSGTIPAGEKAFSISGADPDPVSSLLNDFSWMLLADSIYSQAASFSNRDLHSHDKEELSKLSFFHTYYSPSLDSLNYWFMRRSINLYGEAFVKTIGFEKAGIGATDTGLRFVRNFWAANGIDKAAINIIDGSGLSPQNRVTADALVKALRFARKRAWYASFYESIPTYNGMKLKSGSIGGARSFAGYHTSASGKEYVVAIIVNNYSGSSSVIVEKMYGLLNKLK